MKKILTTILLMTVLSFTALANDPVPEGHTHTGGKMCPVPDCTWFGFAPTDPATEKIPWFEYVKPILRGFQFVK